MNFNNDRTLLSFIILVDVYCVGNLFTCSLAIQFLTPLLATHSACCLLFL